MIIDAHTHICPPEIREDRERFCLPEEKAFTSIYKNPKARLAGAAELTAMMDEEGVDRSVAFGFPWAAEATARLNNDYVLEARNRFPNRLIGLACFDPLQPWAEKEAERCLDGGMEGLGELAIYSAGFDRDAIDRFARLADICRDHNVPLLVHVNEPIGHQYQGKAPLTLAMIYNLARACHNTTLILAHWGGGLFFFNSLRREVPKVLADVYYDTAASPFLYRPQVYELACRIVGPEKVLWGTDYPLLKPGRYFKEMDGLELSVTERRLIKGESAARLFKVPLF